MQPKQVALVVIACLLILVACGNPATIDEQVTSTLETPTSSSNARPTDSGNLDESDVGSASELPVTDVVEAFYGRYPPPAERPVVNGGVIHMEIAAACMADLGFVLEYQVEPGSTSAKLGEVPPEQEARQFAGFEACVETPVRLGWIEQSLFGLEADRSDLYAFYMGVHQCLVDNGFPSTEPPTLEAFLDDPPGIAWHPYEATPMEGILSGEPSGLSDSESLQLEIQETCPVNPGYSP